MNTYMALDDLEAITLDEVVERADLARRVDRKYLVPLATVRALIAGLAATHAVLQIEGRRSTTYRSTYFDTADLASCRAHVQGRRRRWKVRSRLYVEDDLCRVEVKTKDGRGATVKTVTPSELDRYGALGRGDRDFVASVLALQHPEVDVDALTASAEVTYARVCLADISAGTRVTFDRNLSSTLRAGQVWVDQEYAIVETKGGVTLATADRLLLHLGARPRAFSKYVASSAMVHAAIADNDIRQLRGNRLHCRPTPA